MLAILGGSFDPIHNGHLKMAHAVYAALQPRELSFLPCGSHAFAKNIQAHQSDRLGMLLAALKNQRGFTIDQRELMQTTPSYTIDTLKEIREEIGITESLVWIVGMDAFLTLPLWKNWQHILDFAHFAVVPRPGYFDLPSNELSAFIALHQTTNKLELHQSSHGKIYFLVEPVDDVSSTWVRDQLNRGMIPNAALPEVVVTYIKQHQLYTRST